MEQFPLNAKVIHKTLGPGIVVSDLEDSVVVRFANSVEICSKSQLEIQENVLDLLRKRHIDFALEGLARFQAQAIRSINDKWGVFGRSLIDLLPHQLWVCRKARSKNPCRLLVADDVGLGKTIEAGIILSSFMDCEKVKRVLVLTPSSLVAQWQYRMINMFDVRLTMFTSEQDTPSTSFWSCNDCVVASYHTLRMTNNGRQERLLEAEPWDLVIVDEAHHFNRDERLGATLTYNLLLKMEEQNKIKSMLFFTGTPHKGKNFSFIALMQLLSPEFSIKKSLDEQLPLLKDYMIRNNKYNVTDLQGNRLFTEPIVEASTYTYSNAEQNFYDTLTEFITRGFAYAKTQEHSAGNVMMLVLIGMQKLASSSIAAITNALRKRINKLPAAEKEMPKLKRKLEVNREHWDDDDFADERARLEEQLAEASEFISLLEDETPALKELLELAINIPNETKIETVLSVIEKEYQNEQVLFFTEYKATQRLLLENLMRQYGKNSVQFINGDESLEGVHYPDGSVHKLSIRRTAAADKFNSGECRFLIATEAAGEGIDLQENCHVLFHIDLPWNPMRLQQRVGRLNRYGQRKQVVVRIFRNPDTVESRIWDKLNEKLLEIDRTFGAVMEQKEDMFQLVLGMSNPGMFDELFFGANNIKDEETLSKWFNQKTATLGNKDAFKAVKEIVGHASKFNYQQVSTLLPKVDLPDLQSFVKNILSFYHKRLTINDGVLAFQTPSQWQDEFGIFPKYDKYVLNRHPNRHAKQEVLGIGTKVFDRAMKDALALKAQVCQAKIDYVMMVFSVQDLITDHEGEKQINVYGCKLSNHGEEMECSVIHDWELLQTLNSLQLNENETISMCNFEYINTIEHMLPICEQKISDLLAKEVFIPQKPVFSLEGIIIPSIDLT